MDFRIADPFTNSLARVAEEAEGAVHSALKPERKADEWVATSDELEKPKSGAWPRTWRMP